MSEGLEVVRLADGYAPDTPLSLVWRGAKLRHAIELQNQRDMAMTMYGALAAFSGGGTFEQVAGHLYMPQEWDRMKQRKQETEDMNASLSMLNRLRSIASRWEEDGGNRSHDCDQGQHH